MRQWLVAALAVVAAACAGPSRPTLGAAPDMEAPLDARLFPPYYGSVAVQLSKPAYVALFEVVPGRGAALIYPRAGSGFQQTTESWVPMTYSAGRWLYRNDVPGPGGYRATAFSSGFDRYSGRDPYGAPAPRYLFLVASEEPLAIDQFQGDASSIRSYLGLARYAGYDPYDVMERLAYAMLPFAPSDSWVMDVYVDYGYDWGYGYGPGMTAAQASYWPVQCRDGSLDYVRYLSGWGFTSVPCGGASYVGPGRGIPILPPPPPGDSGVVTPPPGEGRDRTASPDSGGRSRAGSPGTPAPRRGDEADAERTRQRIAQLRDEARRASFDEDLAQRLRRDVSLRQRAAAVRGFRQPPHLATESSADRGTRNSAVRSGAARTRSARGGTRSSAGTESRDIRRPSRRASAGSERSRVGSERPTPSASAGSPTRGSSSSSGGRSSGSSSGSSGGRSRSGGPPPA